MLTMKERPKVKVFSWFVVSSSVVSKPSLMQYACTVGAISAKVMVNANVVILFIDI